MKFQSAWHGRGFASTSSIAAGSFALMLAAVMAGTACAQDTSRGGSDWELVARVLVLPPVYRPGVAANAPPDGCAADCTNPSDSGGAESPTAVAGTADDPTDASVAVDGSAPDGSGSQEQQTAAAGDAQQDADSLDSSVGSAQEYQDQQQMAAQELGSAGIIQVPATVIGPSAWPYYAIGTYAPAGPIYFPGRAFPSSPAWMPPPMPRVVPRPSIVPHSIPRTIGGFSGGFPGGFPGRGQESFAPMSGFHGGFGHR